MTREALALQYKLNDLYCRRHGFAPFLDSTVINAHPPARFSSVAEWWQWQIVRAKFDSIQELAGFIPKSPARPHSFLSVLPRGHDKSSLEGRIANFLLCYSQQPILGYIVAADKDQGELVLQAMEEEADLNPWFRPYLTFTRKGCTGPAGSVEVVPADAGSAYGFRGNLYILDEVTHWKNEAVYSAIVSGREKIPGTLLVAITNAGILGSWQHELLVKTARQDPSEWFVFESEGQLASWMTPERVAKIAKQIPKIEADRVLYNKWVDMAVASEFLDALDVLMVVRPNVKPHLNPHEGFHYHIAVDYGPYKDRTALSVTHSDRDRNVVVDRLKLIPKRPGLDEVQIEDVEKEIDHLLTVYRPRTLSFDPFQMLSTIQKYERKGVNVIRVEPRGGVAAKAMANLLRSLVAEHRLWVPPECEASGVPGIEPFTAELKGLVTTYNRLGYRFENSKESHDDRAVVVVMGADQALKFPPNENPKAILTAPPVGPRAPLGNPLIGGFGSR